MSPNHEHAGDRPWLLEGDAPTLSREPGRLVALETADRVQLFAAGEGVASFSVEGDRLRGSGRGITLRPFMRDDRTLLDLRRLVDWTEEPATVVAFESGGPGTDRDTQRREARDFVRTMRDAMASEMLERLEWMRRHADILVLDIPPEAEPSRELERQLMKRAGRRLRELEEGSGEAWLRARVELDALEADERRRFHRLASANAVLLGVPAPPPPPAPREPYFVSLEPGRFDVREVMAELFAFERASG